MSASGSVGIKQDHGSMGSTTTIHGSPRSITKQSTTMIHRNLQSTKTPGKKPGRQSLSKMVTSIWVPGIPGENHKALLQAGFQRRLVAGKHSKLEEQVYKLHSGLFKISDAQEKVEAMSVALEEAKKQVAEFQKQCPSMFSRRKRLTSSRRYLMKMIRWTTPVPVALQNPAGTKSQSWIATTGLPDLSKRTPHYQVVEESTSSTPLIFVLSPGVDPTGALRPLA
ncbi:uncharacterized protein LOC122973245 [Thunnus albacares]|uniref:uncharacterized protein LOC122973245 n=1 Tax=Thunnus albacares TaxID=8236 RepID=UPI001CF6A6E3|nr:uncharacterized protein LOC122973245 [Thunnus albacares]